MFGDIVFKICTQKIKHMKMILLDIVKIPVDDPVAFTFFTGYMAMLAASVFFFFERGQVDGK